MLSNPFGVNTKSGAWFTQHKEMVEAKLKALVKFQLEAVLTEYRWCGPRVVVVMLFQRHAVGQAHFAQKVDNTIDGGTGHSDDKASARPQQTETLTAQGFLVTNMLKCRQHHDSVKRFLIQTGRFAEYLLQQTKVLAVARVASGS